MSKSVTIFTTKMIAIAYKFYGIWTCGGFANAEVSQQLNRQVALSSFLTELGQAERQVRRSAQSDHGLFSGTQVRLHFVSRPTAQWMRALVICLFSCAGSP